MDGNGRDDIRNLLKTFGIKADEIVIAHLARNPGDMPLQIRLILEDRTDYGDHISTQIIVPSSLNSIFPRQNRDLRRDIFVS